MPGDQCDVCGGDAKSYGPRGRRCLACLAADDPALRSDVPAVRHEIAWHRLDADGQPFCAPPCPAAPALRSDEPVSRDPVRPCVDCGALGQWGPFTCCDPCWDKAHPGTTEDMPDPVDLVALRALFRGGDVRRLRIRLAFTEIARAEAVRAGRGANGTLPAALNEAWSHGQWLSSEWRKASSSADAAHAALDALTAKIVEVERVLENWPADGAVALRVLRGEPVVRERG